MTARVRSPPARPLGVTRALSGIRVTVKVVRCRIPGSPIIHLAVATPGGELGGTLCGQARRNLVREDTDEPACAHCARYADRAGVRLQE